MMMTDQGDGRAALLTRAQAGPDLSTPPLYTCSFAHYQRGTGTATRITRGAPRGVKLPSERYTQFASWPFVSLLQPAYAIFRKNLPPDVFRARYVEGLEEIGPAKIAAALRSVYLENDALVLLCFETADVEIKCHRRAFADWWHGKTGVEVPEIGRNTVTPPDAPLIT